MNTEREIRLRGWQNSCMRFVLDRTNDYIDGALSEMVSKRPDGIDRYLSPETGNPTIVLTGMGGETVTSGTVCPREPSLSFYLPF